jgi:chromosome segregation ATPase
MHRTIRYIFATALLSLLVPSLFAAEDAEGARLRETLRGTVLQLRNAQTDLANAQAAQTAQADEIKALKEQLALLKKNAAEDRAIAEKKTTELKAKLDEQTGETARFKDAAEQIRVEYEKAVTLAKATDGKRTQLMSEVLVYERQVADLRAKNVALFRLGKEVLGRYEKVGLGEQFLAREPFVGRTRVALENLVQDYDDKLADQRAKQ